MDMYDIVDHLLDPQKPFPKEFVPTQELRWVNRRLSGDGYTFKFQPVLQQLWKNKYGDDTEWREVPSVDEEKRE